MNLRELIINTEENEGGTEVGSMRGGEGGIDIKGISGWGCVNGRDRMAGLQD